MITAALSQLVYIYTSMHQQIGTRVYTAKFCYTV